jgi:hypothetical protein
MLSCIALLGVGVATAPASSASTQGWAWVTVDDGAYNLAWCQVLIKETWQPLYPSAGFRCKEWPVGGLYYIQRWTYI